MAYLSVSGHYAVLGQLAAGVMRELVSENQQLLESGWSVPLYSRPLHCQWLFCLSQLTPMVSTYKIHF